MRTLVCIMLISSLLVLSGCANTGKERLVRLQVEQFLSGYANQDALAIGDVVASVIAVIDKRSGIDKTRTYPREAFVSMMEATFADPTQFPQDGNIYFGPVTVKTTKDAALASVPVAMGSAAATWVFTLRELGETHLISLWELNDETTVSETKSVIIVGKIIDGHSLEPASDVTVEAWQSSERDRRAGSDNYWKIPNWVNPRVRTREDGTFFLTLHDHPKLQTHQYYVVFAAHEHEYAHQGMYVTMDRVTHGQIIDVGLVALRRSEFTY